MNYKILETHVVFSENGIKEIAVLWADKDSFRATYANSKISNGYFSFKETEVVSNELFQKIAGGGTYLTDAQKKQFFPNTKKWSK